MKTEDLDIPIAVISFLIIPVILCGNILVVLAIYKNKGLQNATNIFVASLAGGDLLVGVMSIPIYITLKFIRPDWANSRWPCTVSHASFTFPVGISLFSLLFVSVDRYIYIMKPLKYPKYMNVRNAVVLVIFMWIYVTIGVGIPFMGWTNWTNETKVCKVSAVSHRMYSFLKMFHMLIAFVATATLNCIILCTAYKNMKTIAIQRRVVGAPIRENPGYRTAKMFGLVVGLFYLCWIPYYSIYVVVGLKEKDLSTAICTANHATLVLALCNSFFNPFIYTSMNKDFKSAFNSLLRRNNSQSEKNP